MKLLKWPDSIAEALRRSSRGFFGESIPAPPPRMGRIRPGAVRDQFGAEDRVKSKGSGRSGVSRPLPKVGPPRADQILHVDSKQKEPQEAERQRDRCQQPHE